MIDFNYLMSTGCFYSYLKRNIITKHEYVILIQRKNKIITEHYSKFNASNNWSARITVRLAAISDLAVVTKSELGELLTVAVPEIRFNE